MMSISDELLSKAIKRNNCVVDGSTRHQLLYKWKDNVKQQRRSNYDIAHGVKRWASTQGYSIVSSCDFAKVFRSDDYVLYEVNGEHEYALIWACGEYVLNKVKEK